MVTIGAPAVGAKMQGFHVLMQKNVVTCSLLTTGNLLTAKKSLGGFLVGVGGGMQANTDTGS